MAETGLHFQWPGLFFALPGLIAFVVLPAALIYIVFGRTHFRLWAKVFLIPACLIGPLLATALWPFLIKISGFIGATGGDGTVPYDFVASKLFGDYSDYVWAGITAILVLLIFKQTGRKKEK
jgi:hypothetical protein